MTETDSGTIHPEILDILTGTFKIPLAELRPDATVDSLEMDSLAVAELAVVLKERTGVDVDAGEVHKNATLAEITGHLDRATKNAAR
ncbi:acyl carrier protein [Streptomyces sp. NPDC049954]|uniref:acyl carrier protein n=1 Tax=Streptomyces sp. NPDC049954 TaxID=3155779 RepID=UPI00343B6C41